VTNPALPPAIDHFFHAMQAGATSESAMMALFAEDAEYSEPFSGQTQTHLGKAAIRQAFVLGWQQPLPEMRIEVDRFDVDGQSIRVDWTCHSPALPGGKGQGTNVFSLSGGLIQSLVTTFR
jgi:ketosteroid isomerase-like protein